VEDFEISPLDKDPLQGGRNGPGHSPEGYGLTVRH
jgi:hypothetical protein